MENEIVKSQTKNDAPVPVAFTAAFLLLFIVWIALLVGGTANKYIYAAYLFLLVFSGYMFVSGTRSAFESILNKLSAIEDKLQNKQ